MGAAVLENPLCIGAQFSGNSRGLSPKLEILSVKFPSRVESCRLISYPSSVISSASKEYSYRPHAVPDDGRVGTPMLDTIESPMHLKNLSLKDLKQLADEIRSELSFLKSNSQRPFRASLAVVELTVAIHHVFNAPVDKILWDVDEHTYPHKLLTGRRSLVHMHTKSDDASGFTNHPNSLFDPIGAGHGCSSISAGLGMAVARDIKGKRHRIVSVISNETTLAGQVYEGMSNAGYLDSDMVVILNDSQHSLHPKPEETPKTTVSSLSSTLSKLQSSKLFRKFRQFAKALTKRLGMHEWAAKVDEYARGLIGPTGSTLFEELGLYYIGPVDGHNIEDLACVFHEVASLDSMGPVLIHVITKEAPIGERKKATETSKDCPEGSGSSDSSKYSVPLRTFSDCFVDALILESEKDKDIVAVHAGMVMEKSVTLFKQRFPDKFFDVGMAEQHAVTFSAGLSRGGMKPFCMIPSAFLQRAYDQVVHDVDRQKIPVRFVITSAGLVGSDGPTHCGAFDITYMACLPNMIVMAPSDQVELGHMVATAAQINDRPVCFRYPRGAVANINGAMPYGIPIEVGKGRILVEGNDIALLGYGSMVPNCVKAQYLLSKLGIEVTVADARFCKPLDIDLVRDLCENHAFLVTVEEGSIGGFGSHVAQFLSLDGQLDAGIKWRPIVLPDTYIEQTDPQEQFAIAGLTGNHIAATVLSLLGRPREALLLMF